MSDFELEYILQDGHPVKVPISVQPMIFGRTVAADIVIDWDSSISGRHFQVFTQGEQMFLADLRSTNGTFVNGQRVPECQVLIGDRIRAGNTTFQVMGTRKALPPSDPSLSSDSVYLSESDFNLLKANSSFFFVQPPRVDESDTADSDPTGTRGTPSKLSASLPAAKANLAAEFSWTLPDGTISKVRLVPDKKLKIGRVPGCEICLAHDPYVRSNHCLIEWRDNECWSTDLKSVGGTWIDGFHQFTCRLSGTGKIRVGHSEICFQITGPPATQKAAVVRDSISSAYSDTVKAVPVMVETCLSGLYRMRSVLQEPESEKPKARPLSASGNPTVASLVSKLLQVLANQYALFVVDFSRIEELPPAYLKMSETSPFAELGDFVAVHLPVIMTAEEFVQWSILVDEIWDRDACYVLFTELPKAEFLAQISELRKLNAAPSKGIPSASSGLFWPSILDAILFTNVQQLADKFTGLCSLILMEVPLQPGRWQAFGTSAIITELVTGESFRVVASVSPPTDGDEDVEPNASQKN